MAQPPTPFDSSAGLPQQQAKRTKGIDLINNVSNQDDTHNFIRRKMRLFRKKLQRIHSDASSDSNNPELRFSRPYSDSNSDLVLCPYVDDACSNVLIPGIQEVDAVDKHGVINSKAMGASQSYSISRANVDRRGSKDSLRSLGKKESIKNPVSPTCMSNYQTFSKQQFTDCVDDNQALHANNASNIKSRVRIEDYTEPTDAQKFVWGKIDSGTQLDESDEEDSHYSKPFQPFLEAKEVSSSSFSHTRTANELENSNSEMSDPQTLQMRHNCVTVSPLIIQGEKQEVLSETNVNISGELNANSRSVFRTHAAKEKPHIGASVRPGVRSPVSQPEMYEAPWDLKKRYGIIKEAISEHVSDKPEPVSSGAVQPNTYESAWDSPEHQRQLESKLRIIKRLSSTSDNFEDAVEFLPQQPNSSPASNVSSNRKPPFPSAGGDYEPAWDLNKSLEDKLRDLQLAQHSSESKLVKEKLHHETWDVVKRQQELKERQKIKSETSRSTADSKPRMNHHQSADMHEEAWDTKRKKMHCLSSPQTVDSGGSTPSSPSRVRNQSSAIIGEPINAMIPLVNQNWYHGNISRDDAEKILRVSREGSYLVRDSSNRRGNILCIKSSKMIIHIQIEHKMDDNGSPVYILGLNSRGFPTIPSMIDYYTQHAVPIKGAEHITLLYPAHCQWSES